MSEEIKVKVEKALNIGCGPANRWIQGTEGIDMRDFGQKYVADFLEWEAPYEYDLVFCHHFVEHIEDQVDLFEKLGKTLKVGGVLDIRVPTLPAEQAFVDPTHVRYIPNSANMYFSYFTKDSPAGHCYTDCEFEIISVDRDRFDWEAHVVMRRTK